MSVWVCEVVSRSAAIWAEPFATVYRPRRCIPVSSAITWRGLWRPSMGSMLRQCQSPERRCWNSRRYRRSSGSASATTGSALSRRSCADTGTMMSPGRAAQWLRECGRGDLANGLRTASRLRNDRAHLPAATLDGIMAFVRARPAQRMDVAAPECGQAPLHPVMTADLCAAAAPTRR